MLSEDLVIGMLRIVALVGFVVAFLPSVRRVLRSETRAIWRTRLALAFLMAALAYTQVYSLAFRVLDFMPWWGGYSVAGAAAVAGCVCAWAFWPWRRA